MEKRRVLFVLVDGMGSLPVKNGKTEWELTQTPNLDKLAKKGACGVLESIDIGIIPGSDTSQLNMLGYPPEKYYGGRGPLEALGIGMKLCEGDIAFRANFATVDNQFKVLDRRAGRIDTKTASAFAKDIASIRIDGLEFIFKNSTEHRGALIIRGDTNAKNVSDTDPHETGKMVLQPEITSDNAKVVKAINKYTAEVHKRLSAHRLNKGRKIPVNMILIRGSGKYQKVESFQQKYGLKACCIAGGALYKGIGHYLGMDVPIVRGATGSFDTDLNEKARVALEKLKVYDFVYLHIKAMDSAGHDGDVGKRIDMIRKIDSMIGKLMSTDAVIVVTGDHSTPPTKKSHSHEPVPLLISNVQNRNYGIKKFCEKECAKGELGRIKGDEVLRLVRTYAGWTEKYGS